MDTAKRPEALIQQVEVGGGGRVSAQGRAPRIGEVLHDFTSQTPAGAPFHLSELRGRANLVLLLAGHSHEALAFRKEAEQREQDFLKQDATVLVIVPPDTNNQHQSAARPWLQILTDPGNAVHRSYGAINENGEASAALYIADRFAEVVCTYAAPAAGIPTVGEVLQKLEFINHICPECEPPEWPR